MIAVAGDEQLLLFGDLAPPAEEAPSAVPCAAAGASPRTSKPARSGESARREADPRQKSAVSRAVRRSPELPGTQVPPETGEPYARSVARSRGDPAHVPGRKPLGLLLRRLPALPAARVHAS